LRSSTILACPCLFQNISYPLHSPFHSFYNHFFFITKSHYPLLHCYLSLPSVTLVSEYFDYFPLNPPNNRESNFTKAALCSLKFLTMMARDVLVYLVERASSYHHALLLLQFPVILLRQYTWLWLFAFLSVA